MVQATAEAIYNEVVKSLPPPERFKLATLILNDIPPRAVVDYSEEWTEEDYRDFAAASWAYITQRLEEEEQDAATGIGHLSNRDWQEVQARLKLALAVP
jgi:hypothetical protein